MKTSYRFLRAKLLILWSLLSISLALYFLISYHIKIYFKWFGENLKPLYISANGWKEMNVVQNLK